jgi:hypothetical protein
MPAMMRSPSADTADPRKHEVTDMSTEREHQIGDVYDAARAYVAAVHRVGGADAAGLLPALVERDTAFHELAFYVDGECIMCDAGTCPLEDQAAS